jgi:hypothetical protein
VVDHDDGKEPNPYFGTCTLCRCKFSKKRGKRNIVELAADRVLNGEEIWVIGTGGKSKRSAGNGTLIYVMRVDERLTREEFCKKYPKKNSDPPKSSFEKHEQFALVSRHFWYFGAKAKVIPDRFKREKLNGFKLEKKGQGFRCIDPDDFNLFLEWLKRQGEPGKYGEPCGKSFPQLKGCKSCKSSC